MITAFIGTTELLLIGGLALLLVGGKKLPEMMRGLGKGVREFKDGMKEKEPEPEQEFINDVHNDGSNHHTSENSSDKE